MAVSVPYTFTNNVNQVIDANQVNADFAALVAAINAQAAAGFSGVQPISTMASLKAQPVPTSTLQVWMLLGNYVLGDRPPAVYVWDAANVTADNTSGGAGTVVALTASSGAPGRAILVGGEV